MLRIKKESPIVNKFFDGNIEIEKTIYDNSTIDTTLYYFRNGDYLLKILVFQDTVTPYKHQIVLLKNGATIPLEDFEFKLFAKKTKEYIRDNF